MTSLVPAISYLTFLDKYVISSLLLIVVITFQGLIGSVEIFYCRTQAVWEEDNVTSVARRLASRTGLSDGMERVPLGYYDADCRQAEWAVWKIRLDRHRLPFGRRYALAHFARLVSRVLLPYAPLV